MKKFWKRRKSRRLSSENILDQIKIDFPTNTRLNKEDVKNLKLPENFFEKIVTTEMELSIGFNHKKLSSLFDLYNLAIEYYSINDPSKVSLYHQRMECYLTEKNTMKNLSKYNIENKVGTEIDLTQNIQPSKVRKNRFKSLARDFNMNETREQVKLVLKDALFLMKYDKKVLRDNINLEMKKQRENWLEKLYKKKSNHSVFRMKRKNTFTAMKNGMMKFGKNGKFYNNRYNYRMMDDETSEFDENKYQNEEDFLKLLNEIDGDNKKDNSDSNSDSDSDSDSEDSMSEDDSEEDDEETEEQEFEEDEKDQYAEENGQKNNNNNDTDNDFNKNINNNSTKEIDENEEIESKQNKNNNIIKCTKKEDNYIKKNILEKVEIIKCKTQSSKYLSKLILPPVELKDDKKEILKQLKEEKEKKENIENNDIKEEEDSLRYNITNENEEIIPNKLPAKRKKSIDDENVIREVKVDDEIIKIVEEKMGKIDRLLNGELSDEDSFLLSNKSLPSVTPSKKVNYDKILPKFQGIFKTIEQKLQNYADKINNNFYLEMFDNYYYKLKELYNDKYKKYIEVNDEYHSSIKEKEFIIENKDNIDDSEKKNIQNIIDGLKEEQKDQIDKILDEYNTNIKILINDFKQNLFKKNVGLQLVEEQLKLDIYTMINEAFY